MKLFHKLIKLFVHVIASIVFFNGQAQNYVITNYTTKDGLPSNLIYTCFKDNEGYLWLATNNGLSRFDGQKFENYGPRDGIYGNDVISVGKLNNGIIGFYINGCFIKDDRGFRPVENNILNKLEAGDQIYHEEIDSLFVVTTRNCLYFFNRKTLQLIHKEEGYKLFAQFTKEGTFKGVKTETLLSKVVANYNNNEPVFLPPHLAQKQYLTIFSQHRGWIYIYDRKTQKLTRLYDAKRAIVNCLFTNDSSLFIGTQVGLSVVNWQNNTETKILKSTPINFTYEDDEGIIWVCSATEGLYRMKKSSSLIYREPFQNKFPPIQTIIKQDSGEVILGNKDGSVTHFSTVRQKTEYFSSKPTRNRVVSIFPTKNETLYFTDNFIINQHLKIVDSLYCSKHVTKYSDDEILISNCMGTILYSIKKKKLMASLWQGRSTTNLVTRAKNIYISTPAFLGYKKNLNDSIHIVSLEQDKPVKSMFLAEDIKGRVWVGTDGWGIYLLDKKQSAIHNFNKKNILSTDNIHSLFIDKKNRVWVGTDKGIILINETSEGVFEATSPFSDLDLQDNEINAICVSGDTVYFSSAKEFLVCVYQHITRVKAIKLKLNKLTINDSLLPLNTNSLSPYQNNLKLFFECPLVSSNEKAVFNFSLSKENEQNNNWQKTNNPIFEFNALAPGKYTLQVKAIDPTVMYSKSNVIRWDFAIHEYFYKTWTFIISLFVFALLLLLGTFFYFDRQKQNRIKKELEVESKINELKLQSLLSQMNPHFLFNSLNVIQKFITSNDDVNALNQLSDFSDLMRESLNHSRKGSINLEEEILFLEQYVKLEKKRFDNEFDFFIHNEIEEDLVDISIPPMLIQPLIENAIKHGVSNMKNPRGEIHTTFRLSHHTLLEIIVSDNGSQRSTLRSSKKKRESHALNIIKERVALIKNEKGAGSFELIINEVGAIACLKIPIV